MLLCVAQLYFCSMILPFDLVVLPEIAYDQYNLKAHIAAQLGLDIAEFELVIEKRSIDARGKYAKIQIRGKAYANENVPSDNSFVPKEKNVATAKEVYIIGAGPAGLFAALKLIEQGLKPIIIEQGKDVRARRRDIALLNTQGIINPKSNYCFGEGGAGTYSDGKLYTRSDKRGNVAEILDLFIYFGAATNIKIEARPHIGTNKLPKIISLIQQFITSCGGQIRFETTFSALKVAFGAVAGIVVDNEEHIPTNAVILAVGHSARQVYYNLHKQGVLLQAKAFALGVRIEHPQGVIDQVQYKASAQNSLLPPAYYAMVAQVQGCGVYSFCMCPGGIIAPCATSDGEVVTNGWSPSKRNNGFANSGIVTEIKLEEHQTYLKHGVFAGIELQKHVEQAAFAAGGGNMKAPAQRLVDFIQNKTSASLPPNSYHPGTTAASLKEILPTVVYERIKNAFDAFNKTMPGYIHPEAILVAPESRTSSPIRIPRDKETMQHITLNGLFPCGEGAGYAGGIVSAAIDGQKAAIAVKAYLQ